MIVKVFDKPAIKLNFTDKNMSSYSRFLAISKLSDKTGFKSVVDNVNTFKEVSLTQRNSQAPSNKRWMGST